MSKKIHVATSPLTGCIFAGTLLKDNRTWGANKCDVTIESIVAVARHGLHFGEPIIISKLDGTPEFEITVRSLTTALDCSL